MVVDQLGDDCKYALIVVPSPECYDAAVELLNSGQVQQILLVDEQQRRSVLLGANPSFETRAKLELVSRNVATDQFRVVTTNARSTHQMFRDFDQQVAGATEKYLVISSSTLSRYYRQVIDQALPQRSVAYAVRSVMPQANDHRLWWRTRSDIQRVMNHGLRLAFVCCHGESEIESTDPYEYLVKQATAS
jgi:hypothetical protein